MDYSYNFVDELSNDYRLVFKFSINENYNLLSVQQSPGEKLLEKATEFMEKLNNNYE